ncbi:hypothetical protein WJX77_003596 [Trebouxia sp. C0004]
MNRDKALRVPAMLLQETGGEFITVGGFVRPGTPGFYPGKSASPPLHSHDFQEECFTVNAGSMGYLLGYDGVERFVQAGNKAPLCLPPRVPHTFWSADNQTTLDIKCKIIPASNSEQFYQTYAGLGYDAGTLAHINPLQILVTFVGGHVTLTEVPKPLWLVIKYGLVPILRTFNIFQPFYPEYTG